MSSNYGGNQNLSGQSFGVSAQDGPKNNAQAMQRAAQKASATGYEFGALGAAGAGAAGAGAAGSAGMTGAAGAAGLTGAGSASQSLANGAAHARQRNAQAMQNASTAASTLGTSSRR